MADVRTRGPLPLLSDYSRFASRHRGAIGALSLLGLAAGFAWTVQQPSTHSATATVALVPVPVYVAASLDELVPPEVTIDTDAELLTSPRVHETIADALGTDTSEAADRLSVTAAPNSHVLHVTVKAESATAAATAANAAVDALVDLRRASLGSLRPDQHRQLRLLVLEQEQLLARAQARRLVIPARDDQFAQLLQLRATLTELEAARQVPAEVLQPARVTADRSQAEVPLTSGAMLGMLAGCLLGAVRDRSSRAANPTEELHHVS